MPSPADTKVRQCTSGYLHGKPVRKASTDSHRLAMKLRGLGLLILLVCVSACADEPSKPKADFCGHWSMGVVAPKYMEAWVETLEVKDDRGRWVKIPQGVVSDLGKTTGWDDGPWLGGGAAIDSAGAPMEVYVRWQSLAEPQTYTWHFTVPDRLRQALVKQESVLWQGKTVIECRSDITIGVAPGGHTVVWVGAGAVPRLEILRGQAEVEPLGPDQGQHEGRYVRISDEAKKYVEAHGIPYGSW
ncbi:DUF2931 family protein [Dyella terrae]|uniref:DUF2931 family protein n=1 Tax=Dyella terrae TaxID=522259 RepID=UPI001EFEEB81|nr:DUF2931 family protein [Dyella terrae]